MQHRPWKKTGFQPTTLIAVVVLVVILFIYVGYFFVIPNLDAVHKQDQILADLQMNEERWQANRPFSFQYVIERDCVCTEAYKEPYLAIHVGESLTLRYVALLDTDGPPGSGVPPDPVNVDDLFDAAAEIVKGPGDIEVTFDPRFGYPSTLEIDRPGKVGGGDVTISVRDFEVIEYD